MSNQKTGFEKLKDFMGIKSKKTDNIQTVKNINNIPELNTEDMSMIIGTDEFNKDYKINFKDTTGTLLAGETGSGKTEALRLIVSSLVMSEEVEVGIINPSGSGEYSLFDNHVDKYINGVYTIEDLMEVHDYLTEVRESLLNRVKNMKRLTGNNNFWNTSAEVRRNSGLKLITVVIDDISYLTNEIDKTRECRKVQNDIELLLKDIIKMGRSAGITVIMSVQKPTVSSVPADIRDACSQRIGFKLNPENAVKLLFGKDVPFGQFSPVDILKSNPGQAVIFNEYIGEFQKVDFTLINDDTLEKLLK